MNEQAIESRDADEFIAQETLGTITEIVRSDGTGNSEEVKALYTHTFREHS